MIFTEKRSKTTIFSTIFFFELLSYELVPYDLFCRKIRQNGPDFRQKVIVIFDKFQFL